MTTKSLIGSIEEEISSLINESQSAERLNRRCELEYRMQQNLGYGEAREEFLQMYKWDKKTDDKIAELRKERIALLWGNFLDSINSPSFSPEQQSVIKLAFSNFRTFMESMNVK